MARFCVNCGKEIKKDDSFCPECGTKVDESYYSDAPTQVLPAEEVASSADAAGSKPRNEASVPTDTAGSAIRSGASAPSDQTRPIASVPAGRSANPASFVAQPQPAKGGDGNKGILIGVLAACVVVLFVLVILFATGAVSLGGNAQGSSNNASQAAQSDGASEGSDSDSTSSKDESSSDDAKSKAKSSSKKESVGKADVHVSSVEIELYDNLSASYKRLGKLSDEINTTYKNAFNNNAMKKDYDKREALYEAAMEEHDKVAAVMGDLQTLEDAAAGSAFNEGTYDDMLLCYEYCLHRIGVICSAWENSLYYDDPKGHEAEICQPLKDAQYDENAKKHKGNVDLERFKALYPKCKPVNPEKN